MSHEFMTDEERIELQKNNPLHGLKFQRRHVAAAC